jgi:hypothetical protein
MTTMRGVAACTAAGTEGAFNFYGGGASAATLSATLQGSGCGSITVKNCNSDTAAISVTVGSQTFTTVSAHNTDQTFYFTFADNDVIGISDGDSGTVAQIESLTFQPCNSDIAAAVNSGGAISTTVSPPAAQPPAMTAVRRHSCHTHAQSHPSDHRANTLPAALLCHD